MTSTPNAPAAQVQERIGEIMDVHEARLRELSRQIHQHPELQFEEHFASAAIGKVLTDAGFDVSVGAYGVPTAVEATFGKAGPIVTFCAEYDALPDLGHACGHNLNAASAVGAAIAAAAFANDLGFRVQLLGTPAEEGGGGKPLLLARGAFDASVLAAMAHAGSETDYDFTGSTTLGIDTFRIEYLGRESHAAVAPHDGLNAGNAATIAQVAIGLLRQQLPDEVRVSAIVSHGGTSSNIIPARATLDIEVRAFELALLHVATKRVLACCEAGALASGCEWSAKELMPRYEPLLQHDRLSELWNENLSLLGRDIVPLTDPRRPGSTDMGNVSQLLPAIHPFIGLRGITASIHTREFETAAASPAGEEALLTAARALAGTAVLAMLRPALRADLVKGWQDRPAPSSERVPHPEVRRKD